MWLELWPRGLRVDALRSSFDELDEAWRAELASMLEEVGVGDASGLAHRICWLLDGLAVSIVVGETGVNAADAIAHAVLLLPAELR